MIITLNEYSSDIKTENMICKKAYYFLPQEQAEMNDDFFLKELTFFSILLDFYVYLLRIGIVFLSSD